MTDFEHEIREQPEVLERILADDAVPALAATLRRREVPLVATLARGSSDNAVTFFAYLAGRTLGLPVASIPPSLVTLYGAPLRLAGALGIGVSQSGESPDVVEGLRALAAAGAHTLALSNRPGSSLERAAAAALAQHAGPERAVAASKTFTSQMMVLARLVAEWADDDDLRGALVRVPNAARALLDEGHALERAALRLTHASGLYVLGRGLSFGAAQETALKLKETAYIDAQAYSSAEFQHGPIAVVDAGDPIVLLGTGDASVASNAEVAARLREVGADLTVVSGEPALLRHASAAVPLPGERGDGSAAGGRETRGRETGGREAGGSETDGSETGERSAEPGGRSGGRHEVTDTFLLVIAGQLLALALATSRGIDPDAPRHLRKVTRTR